jgi:hypothetical protein
MAEAGLGEELIRRGWDQGSLLSAASACTAWLARAPGDSVRTAMSAAESATGPEDVWILQTAPLDENDQLVIVSQPCDITRSPEQEPWVEALRAYWTQDRSIIGEAGRNSIRRFLLQRRRRADGTEEGLIVDATARVRIDKAALLSVTPVWGFAENDTLRPRLFRKWLGERFHRPAVDDRLVQAVQQPVAKAVAKLAARDDRRRILASIREILYFVHNDAAPYEIEMLFLREEGPDGPVDVSPEDAATLIGWIDKVLREGGEAKLLHGALADLRSISVYDYLTATPLLLDYYSGPEEVAERPPRP